MKNKFLFLFMMLTACTQLHAQSKAQVQTDISNTLRDFIGELNYINVNPDNFQRNVYNIVENYGSQTYFMRNGKDIKSIGSWIESYFKIQLMGEDIQHDFTFLKQTIEKVDSLDTNDKRYTFGLILKRTRYQQGKDIPLPEDTLKFTVVWNRPDDYVTLVGLDGAIKPLPGLDGQQDALMNAAIAYIEKKEFQNALPILEPMSEKGNVDAMKLLGYIYLYSKGNYQNEYTGFQYLLKAAEKGDVEAQNSVGVCYKDGEGVPKDEKKAFQWFMKAALQGEATSQHNVGLCYEKGYGIQQDYVQAFSWYK